LDLLQVDVSPEQSVPPSLNLEDDQKNDAPSSNNEVPREDKTNDIPNCNTEVPKENTSAAANDTVTSFPSQGMPVMTNQSLLGLLLSVNLCIHITL
jgi:hypothetical protein